jgi:hypothetical protein
MNEQQNYTTTTFTYNNSATVSAAADRLRFGGMNPTSNARASFVSLSVRRQS